MADLDGYDTRRRLRLRPFGPCLPPWFFLLAPAAVVKGKGDCHSAHSIRFFCLVYPRHSWFVVAFPFGFRGLFRGARHDTVTASHGTAGFSACARWMFFHPRFVYAPSLPAPNAFLLPLIWLPPALLSSCRLSDLWSHARLGMSLYLDVLD
jgi:hypothetical protein